MCLHIRDRSFVHMMSGFLFGSEILWLFRKNEMRLIESEKDKDKNHSKPIQLCCDHPQKAKEGSSCLLFTTQNVSTNEQV